MPSPSTPGNTDSRTVTPAGVAEQAQRILAHALFQNSPRLAAFLRFVVDATQDGVADRLKEFTIGVEVFNRGIAFDPQTDNVVRVSASRLRGKLAEYYQSSGRADPILIELPRGGYVPIFSQQRTAAKSSPPTVINPAVRISVGRKTEMSRLHDALARVTHGAGLMVTVSGDAGMGKTTIVEDFLAEIESRKTNAWSARGRCSERLAHTDAFVPILDCLDNLTRGESGQEVVQLMRSEAPGWFQQLAMGRGDLARLPPKDAGTASHERMRREFVHFFQVLSSTRPVIVFFDDMHWADASTCDLVAYLGSRMKELRLLIVATYLPAALLAQPHPFLPVRLNLERRGASQDVPLQFLTLSEVEMYIQTRFPGNTLPVEFACVVHERTEGNPLFMTDMLNFLRDKGILIDKAGHLTLSVDLEKLRMVIPAGTEQMIRLRIRQLDATDRRILECGAVQGMQFDSAVAAQVLSLDPGDVEQRLQALERIHRFIRFVEEKEFPGGDISALYRFIHVFYQNTLYADLSRARQVSYSRSVAQVLVDLRGDLMHGTAAQVALLFEAGRDYTGASLYFRQAARNAVAIFAFPEAVVLCERGLRALLTLPESRERDEAELNFSLTLGMAQMATRGYAAPEVEKTHRRSRELCLKLNEKRRLMLVLWGLHTSLVNAGELVPALELSHEMREIADSLGHKESVVESLHALGTTQAFMGRLPEAREALERIFSLVPIAGHEFRTSLYAIDPCVTSLSLLARVLSLMGFFDEAIEKAVTAIELANRLEHPPSLTYATFWVGWIRLLRGEDAEACHNLESAMEMCRTHGFPHILEWGRVFRGSALTHLGQVSEGIAEMRKSLDKQMAMRCLVDRPHCLTLLAESLLQVNRHEEALALCDEALRIACTTEGRFYDSETHRIRGKVLLALNPADSVGAETEFQESLCIARASQCRALELRAAISLHRLRRKFGGASVEVPELAEAAAWFLHDADSPWVLEARTLLR